MRSTFRWLFVAVAVLLATSSHATTFAYDIERFSASGNHVGTFVDEFDDGVLTNWTVKGTAVESGGVVTLSDPGYPLQLLNQSTGLDLTLESSQIQQSGIPVMQDGYGDFTLEVAFSHVILPQDHYLGLGFGLGGQIVAVTYANWGTEIAANSPGVSSGFGFTLHDLEDVTVVSSQITASSIATQQVLTTSGAITGDIVLRLSFDDASNVFTASASQDGGFNYIDIGQTTAYDTDWFGYFNITADPREIAVVPEPTTGLLTMLGLGLLALGVEPR